MRTFIAALIVLTCRCLVVWFKAGCIAGTVFVGAYNEDTDGDGVPRSRTTTHLWTFNQYQEDSDGDNLGDVAIRVPWRRRCTTWMAYPGLSRC